MTPELRDYYEKRFDMFSHQGWKQLLEDVDKMIEANNNISSISDEKTLHFRQGEVAILNWLKNLQAVSEDAYQMLQLEDAK